MQSINKMRAILLRLILLCVIMFVVIHKRSDRWLRRQYYKRPIYQLRLLLGFFNTQWQEIKEDPYIFHRYT